MAKKSSLKARLKAQKSSASDNGFKPPRDARKGVIEFTARQQTPLRTWIVSELPKGQLGIECPRCHGKAVVNKKKWLFDDIDFLSRGCTYCYAPIFIPKSVLPKTDERRYDIDPTTGKRVS